MAWICKRNPSTLSKYQNIGEMNRREWTKIIHKGCISFTKTLTTERKYVNPKISATRRMSGIGNKMIVQVGTNWKIGINPKKTPMSTKARRPMAMVETTGKNSLFTFRDFIIPALEVRLERPPAVPLPNIWKNIIPVIR